MGVTTALKSGHHETGHTAHTYVYFHNKDYRKIILVRLLSKILVKYLTVAIHRGSPLPNSSQIRYFSMKIKDLIKK